MASGITSPTASSLPTLVPIMTFTPPRPRLQNHWKKFSQLALSSFIPQQRPKLHDIRPCSQRLPPKRPHYRTRYTHSGAGRCHLHRCKDSVPLQGAVAPVLDVDVSFLVQLANCKWRHFSSPQDLHYIFPQRTDVPARYISMSVSYMLLFCGDIAQ